MIRTQIQLTPEQLARLKELSHEYDLAVAALIRTAVAEYLDRQTGHRSREKALAAVGMFRADAPDIAREHDRYLAEIYGDSSR